MSIGQRERAILVGLANDIDTAKSEYAPTARDDFTQFKRVRRAEEETAVCDPRKWLGVPITASQSVMNGRSYARLEQAGLVEKIHSEYSTKTSALRITPAGRDEVRRLLQQGSKTTPEGK